MPFYEFACQDCHQEFSLVLSLKERESGRVTCPGCGSVRRMAGIGEGIRQWVNLSLADTMLSLTSLAYLGHIGNDSVMPRRNISQRVGRRRLGADLTPLERHSICSHCGVHRQIEWKQPFNTFP